MSKNRDDSYIFCAALIRASERSFLPESELTRAAEAADFAGAMSVLTENGYGSLKAPEKPSLYCSDIPRIITTPRQFLRPSFWELTPKNI